MHEDDLEKEYRNSFLVKALDPENAWSITALHACTMMKEQQSDFQTHQLIFKNGGKSLADLLLKPDVQGHWSHYIGDEADYSNLEPNGVQLVIEQVKKILPGLEQLNTKYLHDDLHFGNIVTDGKTPRLIDFASLRPLEEKIAEEQKLMNRCITVTKVSTCSWLPERLQLLVTDEAKSRDIQALWSDLYELLSSPWVTATFPNKYTEWTAKYKDLTRFINLCPEYVLSIMNVPA
jgi:hypothetical protein